MMDRESGYIKLASHVLLRRLEAPYLYDRKTDVLYELNDEGFDALARCDGDITVQQASLDKEFLQYCLDEHLIEVHSSPAPRKMSTPCSTASHSLRYLEVQVTRRCDLACRHCYLGSARKLDLDPTVFETLCKELDDMGGLRVLVSGGEPLMHPHWEEINGILSEVPFRRVLLSNGQLLDKELVTRLHCDAVQLSLDGMRHGHESLRGYGTFDKVIRASRSVLEGGLDLSFATMVHSENLGELDSMAELVRELGAVEWSIDAPCVVGRLENNSSAHVTPDQAAKAMGYAFGGTHHGGNGGMACGLHLATVGADGTVAQCGFYFDQPLGQIEEGLATVWSRRKAMTLESVDECRDCHVAEECGGGCRYRAPTRTGPDVVMCAAYGMKHTQSA